MDHEKLCVRSMIGRRLLHVRPVIPSDIDFVIFGLYRLAPTVPCSVLFSVLKTMCNCWCTSNRFRSLARSCIACCADDGDSLRNMIGCSCCGCLFTYLPHLPASFCYASPLARLTLSMLPCALPSILRIGLCLDMLYHVYHSRRHSAHRLTTVAINRLGRARLIAICREPSALHSLVAAGIA
eukprot:4293002-Pyramimonas_sp.AAC.1